MTQHIMFWAAVENPLLPHPQDCVRADIPHDRRALAAKILGEGRRGAQYKGHAICRLCGIMLGSSDFGGYGFTWPEKAEHYVLAHAVWIPGLDQLIDAYQRGHAV
jgi:hypothetical protein